MTNSTEVSHEILRRLVLFEDLDETLLAPAAQAVSLYTFDTEEPIIREGEVGRDLYGLLEGSVEILKETASGRTHRLAVCDAGEVFGELGFVLGEPRTANVRALDSTTVLCLEESAFQELDEEHPETARALERNIMRMLANRQKDMNRELLGLVQGSREESEYHVDEEADVGDQLMHRWTV